MDQAPRDVIAKILLAKTPEDAVGLPDDEAAPICADQIISALADAGFKIEPMLSEEIIRRDRDSWPEHN